MPDLKTNEAQKKYLFISAIPIIALMSLRHEFIHGSGDIWSYYEFYKFASQASMVQLFEQSPYEPGFVILNKVSASIVPNPQFIFFLEGLICVAAICRFIYKYSVDPFLGILFFITLGTMIFELTGVRQGIAMSICLVAVEFIEPKRITAFILMILLAASFHKTAIAFFPLYFLAKIKPTVSNFVMAGIVVVLILLISSTIIALANKLFDMSYGRYIGNEFGGWAPILIFVITLLLYLMSINRTKQYLIFNMLAVGLVIYVLRYSALAAERISFYFTPAVVVALPMAIRCIPDRTTMHVLYTSSAVLAITLYLFRFARAALTWQV